MVFLLLLVISSVKSQLMRANKVKHVLVVLVGSPGVKSREDCAGFPPSYFLILFHKKLAG